MAIGSNCVVGSDAAEVFFLKHRALLSVPKESYVEVDDAPSLGKHPNDRAGIIEALLFVWWFLHKPTIFGVPYCKKQQYMYRYRYK